MEIIKPSSISGFPEHLPEIQSIEDKYKSIISRNYSTSGFTSIKTPVVEREDILMSKGGDDNELYGIHRLNGDIILNICMPIKRILFYNLNFDFLMNINIIHILHFRKIKNV